MKDFLEADELNEGDKKAKRIIKSKARSALKVGVDLAVELDRTVDLIEKAADMLDDHSDLKKHSVLFASVFVAGKKANLASDCALSSDNLKMAGKIVSYASDVCKIARAFVSPTPKNVLKALKSTLGVCDSTCKFVNTASRCLRNYNGNRKTLSELSRKAVKARALIKQFDKKSLEGTQKPRFYGAYHCFRRASNFFESSYEVAGFFENVAGIFENGVDIGINIGEILLGIDKIEDEGR